MEHKYQKIPSVFRRDDTRGGRGRVLIGEWARPEFEALRNIPWWFTEKVNGTNVRVQWDGHRVTFGGRTDDAQIPASLVDTLFDLFKAPGCEELFEQTLGESPALLFGEGYGQGVHRDSRYYAENPAFVLFDVRVGDWWLERPNVESVAAGLGGLDVAPILFTGTLQEAVDAVGQGKLASHWGKEVPLEGLVGQPSIPLYTRSGERIIVKVKTADLRA